MDTITPSQPAGPVKIGRIHNPLEVMQPGEKLICEIKRHPIGLILGPYLVAAFLTVLAVLAIVLAPMYRADVSDQTLMGIMLGAGLVIVAMLLYVYVATMIYTANRWIITSDSLTQILQTGLFDSEMSQLSLEDLEDVTVNKNGLLQTLFNYGTLHCETAGERSKFVFIYCPSPDQYARDILAAREAFRDSKPDRP
ncbi:MAG TPA: PH domain-containing protein [Candidatus Saccharimonadales bacterium]|nr:PH domain-containing protein [Candidatus Saccharimonadales bacterium]